MTDVKKVIDVTRPLFSSYHLLRFYKGKDTIDIPILSLSIEKLNGL